jgi:hypothetical protein
VPKPKVIEDQYGQELCAEVRETALGNHVWLARHLFNPLLRSNKYLSALTPDQARNLSTQLNEAADEIDPAGMSTDAA